MCVLHYEYACLCVVPTEGIMCVLLYVCAEVWKTGCELRVRSVCVCVCRGITEARNRDLVFVALRMMTLFQPLSSHHLAQVSDAFWDEKNSKRQGEQTSQEAAAEAGRG